jgi:hypothetical protein
MNAPHNEGSNRQPERVNGATKNYRAEALMALFSNSTQTTRGTKSLQTEQLNQL